MRKCPLSYPEYDAYLCSGHWRELRVRIREQRHDRCELCGQERDVVHNEFLNLHHLTYERLGAERDTDLQLLCWNCHCEAHEGWDPFE